MIGPRSVALLFASSVPLSTSSCATTQTHSLSHGRNSSSPPRIYRLAAGEYHALDELARFYGFAYEPRRSSAILRGAQRLLHFSSDPREGNRRGTLDGYSFWLNHPVADWQGRFMLSRADFTKTIYPLLWPQQAIRFRPIRIIVLDPGHGGRDEGTRGNGLVEKHLTLEVAQRVKSKLEARDRNVAVLLTRSRDVHVELRNRSEFARDRRADLFVSIHFNAVAAGQARGFETYALPPAHAVSTAGKAPHTSALPGNQHDAANIYLAYLIHAHTLNSIALLDRGIKRARFAVLNHAPCPAVLVECGFLTNPTDAAQIRADAFRDRLADGIARGILAYKQTFPSP